MQADATAVRLIVVGHVQGVGFRLLVRSVCQQYGLLGWVRNREDGSVEGELLGPKSKVDAAIGQIRSVRAHQIRSLTATPIPFPPTQMTEFEIRP
jgi:acylphosphatase